jgi:HEAT repeat protein
MADPTRSKHAGGALALVVTTFCAAGGQAAPFAFTGQVDVGRPPKSTSIRIEQSERGVQLQADGGVRVSLPVDAPQRADLEALRLANGAVLGLVRVTAAGGREAAALLGRRGKGRVEILWSGALDARGDPGERRGNIVDVQDHTGDGQPDVLVAQFDESARICGQQRSLLRPRLVDPESLRLRPVAVSRLPDVHPPSAELALAEQSPGPTRPPLLRSLRLTGVSSQPGNEREPWLATLPSALTDGDPATFWSEGHGGGGRGEFASFLWDAPGHDIRALAIVPLPAGLAADQNVAVARALWLVGEDGTRLKLKLPERVRPGQRYWAELPKPFAGRCVSLVFEDAAASPAGKSAAAVLAEVEAYTDLDFAGGVDRLVQQLAIGGAGAADAAQLLATLGPEVVDKLHKVWPTLPTPGRRRALRVLGRHAEAVEVAREMLAAALDDPDPDVRRAAFEALLEAGPASRALLVPGIAAGGEPGDATALALARRAPAETIAPLLAALDRTGGSERAALREAIALCYRMGGAEVADAVRAWTASGEASIGARASLALALSRVQSGDGASRLVTELVARDATQARSFEDRWRLVQAARALPSAEEVDAWLTSIADTEERWMLRAAAIEALAERKSAQNAKVAAVALKDAYPRVRAAAASALAHHPEAQRLLAEHAFRDRWPFVRAAALDAISGQPGAEPILRKGVGDGARIARAAAVRGLTAARIRDAWPLVKARLEDRQEWPEVLTEAVRFAAELCIADADKGLLRLLERGIKPDAWGPDAELAVQALEALLKLGGPARKAAMQLANSQAAPPSFRAAIEARPAGQAACAAER